MTGEAADPTVNRLREAILEQDRMILAAINLRLRLVSELKQHKLEQGYAFEDPGREQRLLATLAAENAGPLSPESVHELFRLVIAIGKRDVYGLTR